MILAYELVIKRCQDVKADQNQQEHRYIEVQRQEKKSKAEPATGTAGETGAARAGSIPLKAGVSTRLKAISSSPE
jgi:hypothetical protein